MENKDGITNTPNRLTAVACNVIGVMSRHAAFKMLCDATL